jgi:glycosyltransferase involved in cell wall biosynthesis
LGFGQGSIYALAESPSFDVESGMKVLIVNTFDRDGGAARSARRLHWALRKAGVDSRMLVLEKTGDDPHTREVRAPIRQTFKRGLPFLDALPQVPYRRKDVTHWSNTFLPGGIAHEVAEFDPDIVHLHWINRGFLNLNDLAVWQKPVVWTLHDCWPFTGGCHYPVLGCQRFRGECGACPALGSNRGRDLSRINWKRKHLAFEGVPLHVVAPSQWLMSLASDSRLFQPFSCDAIPNAIDTSLYKPGDRARAREALGLPQEKPLIFMVAMNPHQDQNKGGALALKAIHLAAETLGPDAAELVVAGEPAEGPEPESPWPVRRMGVIRDEARMVQLYQAADIQVVPSYLENLSNAIMEACACGLPCVAFRAGGNGDMVIDGKTGLLANPYDPASLADCLVRLLEDPGLRWTLGDGAREHILHFSDEGLVASHHKESYRRILVGEL